MKKIILQFCTLIFLSTIIFSCVERGGDDIVLPQDPSNQQPGSKENTCKLKNYYAPNPSGTSEDDKISTLYGGFTLAEDGRILTFTKTVDSKKEPYTFTATYNSNDRIQSLVNTREVKVMLSPAGEENPTEVTITLNKTFIFEYKGDFVNVFFVEEKPPLNLGGENIKTKSPKYQVKIVEGKLSELSKLSKNGDLLETFLLKKYFYDDNGNMIKALAYRGEEANSSNDSFFEGFDNTRTNPFYDNKYILEITQLLPTFGEGSLRAFLLSKTIPKRYRDGNNTVETFEAVYKDEKLTVLNVGELVFNFDYQCN